MTTPLTPEDRIEALARDLIDIAHHFESTGYAHGKHINKANSARQAAALLRAPKVEGEALTPSERAEIEAALLRADGGENSFPLIHKKLIRKLLAPAPLPMPGPTIG